MRSNAPPRRQESYGFSLAEHTDDVSGGSVKGMDDEDGGESGDDGSNQDTDTPRSSAALAADSRVAALNRELKALELRFFRTREQVEKTREQVSERVDLWWPTTDPLRCVHALDRTSGCEGM